MRVVLALILLVFGIAWAWAVGGIDQWLRGNFGNLMAITRQGAN